MGKGQMFQARAPWISLSAGMPTAGVILKKIYQLPKVKDDPKLVWIPHKYA
jgi:hypothetical protein